MELTRTREFVINIGNYESFRTLASVKVDGLDIIMAEDRAEQLLDAALKNDLLEAAKLSNVRDTYVLTWNEEHYGNNKN